MSAISDEAILAVRHLRSADAAKALGFSLITFEREVRFRGLPKKEVRAKDPRLAEAKKRLAEDFLPLHEGFSDRELGEMFGRPMTWATKMRKTIGVKKDPCKRWYVNPHPRGALGMHHSEKVKAVISANSIKTWRNMTEDKLAQRARRQIETKAANGTLVRNREGVTWKGGWREVGGKRKYFRSRWEFNYACFLEWLKVRGDIVEWEHEPKTFWFDGIKRGCVSYLPDFRVTETDKSECYHEVKGWMDDRSKTKIKRMAKYFPKVKLVVIDSKAYKSLKKKLAAVIPGWEHE